MPQPEDIVEGIELSRALNTEPGQTILVAIEERMAQALERLLDKNVTDEEAITYRHLALGMMSCIDHIGDKITIARSIAAKRIKKTLHRPIQEQES